ncbi:hypothetical protein RCL_jg19751.t1 [Rhizophagus clarus]|uniref:Uncharacterized protein n=1 Tax=Rhizophagus clarus TaxID=94130 RepID=A0A8H3MAU5_9GLOM|nr:hypothetical protein RCL_jg19751.t1 [Rhizophagus clarus]
MKLFTFTLIALFLTLCLISMINGSQINSLNSNNGIIKRDDSSTKLFRLIKRCRGCGSGRSANRPSPGHSGA